jgi:uncharacterized protein YjbI with pentapeptide repeats
MRSLIGVVIHLGSLQMTEPRRPTTDDPDAWKLYWAELGMPWRWMAEIDRDRREMLLDCLRDGPRDAPFRDVPLSRADVEWLLKNHESDGIVGPVDLRLLAHQGRQGLNLSGAQLNDSDLRGMPLIRTNLQRADLIGAKLQGAVLVEAKLQGARLIHAELQGASLILADLQGANLVDAKLQGADLTIAKLQGAYLMRAGLQGADLRGAFFDSASSLSAIGIGQGPEDSIRVGDTRWGGVNLAVVNWSGVKRLKDELSDVSTAVRAYRQLALALRGQGLVDEASRFAYRGQKLRLEQAWRDVRQGHLRRLGALFGLGALWLLAGFGYRPGWTFLWWAGIIIVGWIAFYLGSPSHTLCPCWPPGPPPADWVLSALIESITACHGRGVFFTDKGSPTFVQGVIAAVEAVFGLAIEATFIATFTQRFLGR